LGSASPDSRFILVARNQESAEYAKQQLQHSSVSDENIIPMACDHSSFTSIRNFCDDLRKRLAVLNSCGIDVMCLNAAILMGEEAGPHFTEDGFEITFQTNHLAPFLIANLSYDLLNPGSRVVVTTSGLYAFSTFQNFVGITDPETGKVRKNFETINGEAFHYKKNYSASKLCNIAFGAELNRRLQKKDSLAVCFSPGLITSTGLFRRQKGGWQDTIDKKKAIGMNETKEWGGSVLAWMALSDEAGKRGGEFWRAPYGISQRGGSPEKDLYSEPTSEEASDPLIQNKLWRLSAELTGISSDLI
jgi:NAD(P)-dependent dehydrogenase (short-subunit alcohol dehydrogenase family)